jgi:hypothetical protein
VSDSWTALALWLCLPSTARVSVILCRLISFWKTWGQAKVTKVKDRVPEICVKIKTAMAEDEELRLAPRFLCPEQSRMFANVVLGGLSAMPHGRLLVAASR